MELSLIIAIIAIIAMAIMGYIIGSHGKKEIAANYLRQLDAQRNRDGSTVYRTKAGFRYPLSKTHDGK